MKFSNAARIVHKEIAEALALVDDTQIDVLVSALVAAPRIFVAGAGRVGLASRAFAMRLMHLGLKVFFVGDVTTPAIGPGDLLLICSGSGETASIALIADLAAKCGAEIATITRDPEAHIGRRAKTVVQLMVADAGGKQRLTSPVQPMTSLFEQSLFLLLDAVVLGRMSSLGQTDATMRQRHNNLE